MRENRMEIANSNDKEEIEYDWRYLETHTVPQLNKAIDWGQPFGDILNNINIIDIVEKSIKFR
jgi:hypothetical protein